tara:strand:- start:367 stop:582 length:216 start_codon:yes stop_codon:yes gene_type:complete
MRVVVPMSVIMRIGVCATLIIRRNIEVMVVKQSQEQQHKDQTTDYKIHGLVDGLAQFKAMRNEMQTGDTKH